MTAKQIRDNDNGFQEWWKCVLFIFRKEVNGSMIRKKPRWKPKGATWYSIYKKDNLTPSQAVDLFLLNCT